MSHGLVGCGVLTVGGLVCGRGCELASAWEDLSVAAPVVEPVDVFEGGELDVFDALPGSMWVDELPSSEVCGLGFAFLWFLLAVWTR